ncbi:MAG TPA: hypothetical protein DCM49_04610 [Lachnospiraceae bacterium]|nr:hypothetical protein [Lachnospiraceae bacterium]
MMLLLKVLLTEFIAEMGDKTQLMLVAMTSKYKLRSIILGTAAAILVLNGLAVLAGGIAGSIIPEWLIRLIAAFAFMCFAVSSAGAGRKEDTEEAVDVNPSGVRLEGLAVFCTFFIAEFGDKTQLTAITFGANEGPGSALIVWLGCSAGLFAADVIGMLAGYLLNSRMPEGFLHMLSFIIFSIFGVITLRRGLVLLLGADSDLILPIMSVIILLFAGICICRMRQSCKKRAADKFNPDL